MSFYNNIHAGYGSRHIKIRHLKFRDELANSEYTAENFGIAIKRDNGKESRDWYMLPAGHNGWCSGHTNYCSTGICECEEFNWKELDVLSYDSTRGLLEFNLGDAFDDLRKGKYLIRVYLNCGVIAVMNLQWIPTGKFHYFESESTGQSPVPPKDCDAKCEPECTEKCGCDDCGEFEDVIVKDEYEAFLEWRPRVVKKPVRKGSLPFKFNVIKGVENE